MAEQDAQNEKYRLVTRSDFDGLVCAVLLRENGLVDHVAFAHPKDMQDGVVSITKKDITTNLPYVPGCYLAFDHHASEAVRNAERANHIIDPNAPSAARVVYDHYGGKDTFPTIGEDLMTAVDKSDAAMLEMEDVTNPQGWILLGFLMDARTGLGRFRDFRISNYDLMMKLIDLVREKSIDEILLDPDVKERVALVEEYEDRFDEQLKRCTTIHDNVAVLDLRWEDNIWPGNRFKIYTMFPDCNISVHIMRGRENVNTVFAIGKSIFNRSSKTNVGELCLAFRGGGHHAAGTCQVANGNAENVKNALIKRMVMDG